MVNIISLFIHLDKYLFYLIQEYGAAVYFILFMIIFAETGLVVTPFLPGDSLLFVAGTLASQGYLNVIYLFILLSFAAILGDNMNYLIGNLFGKKLSKNPSLVKSEYMKKTYEFYERHGGKTIILARFIPIIRTFAPFVAGISRMNFKRFFSYNIIGGIVWVALFVFGGYYFGSIPFVKNNLTIVIIILIFSSLIPAIYEYIKGKKK